MNKIPPSTLREKIGQLVWPAVRASRGEAGLDALQPLLESYPPGGVIVFGEGESGVESLIARMRLRAPAQFLVSSDLERGCGQQVLERSSLPAAMAIAAGGHPDAARQAGHLTGIEARAAGVDVVFAPVVDVNTASTNPIIATRSYGDSPARVAEFGAAFAAGLAQGGALAVAKHWPGHGSTVQDSHEVLARVTRDRAAMEAVDLPPFRRLVDADVAGIMVGHLAVPALDEEHPDRPATISPVQVQGMLRGQLGFEGLVVTDALDMGGFPLAEAAPVEVVRAGCDVLLMPRDPAATGRAIEQAIEAGTLPLELLDAAVARIAAAHARLAGHASDRRDVPDTDLGQRLLEASITRRGPETALPPGAPVQLTVFGEDDSGIVVPAFREALEALGHTLAPQGFHVALVLTSVAAWLGSSRLPTRDRKRLEWALQYAQLQAVCVLGSPYEALDLPDHIPTLVGYEGTPATAQQVAAALTGRAPAPGTLPVGSDAPHPTPT